MSNLKMFILFIRFYSEYAHIYDWSVFVYLRSGGLSAHLKAHISGEDTAVLCDH